MVKGDHPGGSLAGNESLLASSTISVGLRRFRSLRTVAGCRACFGLPRYRPILRPDRRSVA